MRSKVSDISSQVLIMIFMTGCLLLSCEKGFEELQINPNGPNVVNPDFLFTEGLIKSVEDDRVGINTEIWALMVWTMQMADINGIISESEAYAYGGVRNDDIWDRWHVGVLANIQEVINLTADNPYLINKNSIARIWKAYMYHKITDLWGDVPYSEALQASDLINPVLTPSYDRQEDIYADLLFELKSAVALMDPELPSFGSADPLYQGDINKWSKFANSLRLRLAVRISGVAPLMAQEIFDELLSNEEMLINQISEGAHFPFQEGTESPMFKLEESGQGMRRPSKFLIDRMIDTDDPRLTLYTERTQSSELLGTDPYVGTPNLLTSEQLNELDLSEFNTSAVGSYFLDINLPGQTLSYAEVCFLKAEIAFKGLGGSLPAREYYEAGVRASIESLNIASDSIDDFLENGGQFNNTLEQIITQKWMNLVYRDGFEAFAELRRTSYPSLTTVDGLPIDWLKFPQRLPYPNSEIVLNNANVTAVGEGIDDMFTKVWWANF